jgi:hypothetical protein
MDLFAPFETPTLEPLFAFLELERVAPLVPFEARPFVLTEASSLEQPEAPLEVERFCSL